MSQPKELVSFRQWLESNGAYIHPSLYFAQGDHGLSVYTNTSLDTDATIVSCPTSLIVTPKLARDAIEALASKPCPLDDRELVCTYLILHSCIEEDYKGKRIYLRHQPYIDTLPLDFMTPIFWNANERSLLEGTNLHSATVERMQNWRQSYQRSKSWLQSVNENWIAGYTPNLFIRAQTWLSSRAFPSSLLNDPPSLSDPNASPVLVPLVDTLNHARGTPISWSIDNPSTTTQGPNLSLVLHKSSTAGDELCNNYGAKPNDELLLGYGFVLENNPEDTLLLKLPGSERRFIIGRKATGQVDSVWNEIGRRLQESFPTESHSDDNDSSLDVMQAELELEIGQLLPEMIVSLRDRLPDISTKLEEDGSLPGVRPEARRLVQIYVQGQREILDDLLGFAERRLKAAIQRAEELGIEITPEDDEEE